MKTDLDTQQLFLAFRQFRLKSLEVFPTEQSNPCLSFSEREKVPHLKGSHKRRLSFSTGTHGQKATAMLFNLAMRLALDIKFTLKCQSFFGNRTSFIQGIICGEVMGGQELFLMISSAGPACPRRRVTFCRNECRSSRVRSRTPPEANSHAVFTGETAALDTSWKNLKATGYQRVTPGILDVFDNGIVLFLSLHPFHAHDTIHQGQLDRLVGVTQQRLGERQAERM